MTTLFSSFRAFIISSETVKRNVLNTEKIRFVNKRISRDIESIFITHMPRYKKPEFNSEPDPYRLIGREMTLGQQVISTIEFTSTAHIKNGSDQRSGIARIAYYLKENENDTYNLYRADTLPPFPDEIESCADPLLLNGIYGFEIIYKDFEGQEYKHWDSEDEEFGYTLPVSLDVKFTFGTGEQKQVSIISIGIVNGRQPIE